MRAGCTAIAALALYAAVVVWLTWPLAAHARTHLSAACGADCLVNAWVLAHETHALTTAPTDLLNTNMYYPTRHTLFYEPTAFASLPWFAPVFLATGNPALALNVTWLAGLALTAWTLHLVVWRWTRSQLGGAVAAATFLATRWVWTWTPATPFAAGLAYLPLIVLYAAERVKRLRAALPLVPLVVMQCLTDPLYLAATVLVPLTVVAVVRLARGTDRAPGLRLAAALGFALLALLPVYVGYLDVAGANPDLREQTVWAFSRNPVPRLPGMQWLEGVPYVPMSLPADLLTPPAATAIPHVAVLVILAGALVRWLAARTATPASAWRHATFWAAAGAFMSLTPLVNVLGRDLWLPHLVLAARLAGMRIAYGRLGICGLIGLALLAGVAFAECARRLSQGGRIGQLVLGTLLIAALLGADAVGPGYGLAKAMAPDTPVVRALQAGHGPVLELPVGDFGVTPALHTRALYRSIYHWRPLLNGYGSYFPVGFRERMALAARLPDAEALTALRRETGLATVLVHTTGLRPPARAAWLAAAEGRSPGLELVAREGSVLVFAAR